MSQWYDLYTYNFAAAFYASQQTDESGQELDGNRQRVLRFESGQLPPVTEFWSIAMYGPP